MVGLGDLGVDPRMLNDILHFCSSPATAVSLGVLMVQLKEWCFNQDVCVLVSRTDAQHVMYFWACAQSSALLGTGPRWQG